MLDAVTVRNLELIEPLFAGADAGVTLVPLDRRDGHSHGQTAAALVDAASVASKPSEINARLDAVEAQVKDTVAREELRRALDGILDLERLLSRVTLETANPRDVLALAASLGRIPAVRACRGARLAARSAPMSLHATRRRTGRPAGSGSKSTIVPEPPISLSDGGVIESRSRCRTGPTARPEPQQQAISGADRAAGAAAHRHRVR